MAQPKLSSASRDSSNTTWNYRTLLQNSAYTFYTQYLYDIVHSSTISNSHFSSICLLSLQYILIILFTTPVDNAVSQSLQTNGHELLGRIRISTSTTNSETLMVIFFCINTLILLAFLSLLIYFIQSDRKRKEAAMEMQQQLTSSNADSTGLLIPHIPLLLTPLSFLLTVYPYILFFPSLSTAFTQMPSMLSIVTLILTLFNGAVCMDVDYDYLLSSRNRFARPFSRNWSYLTLAIEFLLALVVHSFSNNVSIEFIGILCFLGGEFLQCLLRPYYYTSTQTWAIFLQLMGCFSSIICGTTENPTLDTSILVISTLALIPILYALADIFTTATKDHLFSKLNSVNAMLSVQQLDYLMHSSNLQMPMGNNSENHNVNDAQIKLQIVKQIQKSIYNGSSQHHSAIVSGKAQDLFDGRSSLSISCSDFFKSTAAFKESDQQSLLGESTRNHLQKMLVLGLKVLFEQTIHRPTKKLNVSKDDAQGIPYIVFLMEALQSSKQFWIEYQKALIYKTNSPVFQQREEQAKQDANAVSAKRIQILNSLRRSIVSPFTRSTFSAEFVEVINYENRLNAAARCFEDVLRLKVAILLTLRHSLINIVNLIANLKQFFKQRDQLLGQLNGLQRVHSNNTRLQQLQSGFFETMAVSEYDLVGYNSTMNQSVISNRQDAGKNQGGRGQKRLIAQDSFDPSTCVITAEYEDSCELTIKHVSANFLNIFPGDHRFIAGKSIDVILPSFLRPVHPKFVRNYIHATQSISDVGEVIVDAQRKKLIFAGVENSIILIPMWIEVKLNQFADSESFGMCAKISRADHDNQQATKSNYIIYDSLTNGLVGMTSQIARIVFPKKNQLTQFLQKQQNQIQQQPQNQKQKQKEQLKLNIHSQFPLIAAAHLNESNNHIADGSGEKNTSIVNDNQEEDDDDDNNNSDHDDDSQQETAEGLRKQFRKNQLISKALKSLRTGMSAQMLFVVKSPSAASKETQLSSYQYFLLTLMHRKFEVKNLEHLNIIEITHIAEISAQAYPSTLYAHLQAQLRTTEWVALKLHQQHMNTRSMKHSMHVSYHSQVTADILKQLMNLIPNQQDNRKQSKHAKRLQQREQELVMNNELHGIQLGTFGWDDAIVSGAHVDGGGKDDLMENETNDIEINLNRNQMKKSDFFKAMSNQLVPSSSHRIESNLSMEILSPNHPGSKQLLLHDSQTHFINQSAHTKSTIFAPFSPEHHDRSSVLGLIDTLPQNNQLNSKQNNYTVTNVTQADSISNVPPTFAAATATQGGTTTGNSSKNNQIKYSYQQNKHSKFLSQSLESNKIISNILESDENIQNDLFDQQHHLHHHHQQTSQQQFYGYESERYTVQATVTDRNSSLAGFHLNPNQIHESHQPLAKERLKQQKRKEHSKYPQILEPQTPLHQNTATHNASTGLQRQHHKDEVGSQASSKKSNLKHARRLLKQIMSDRNTPISIKFSSLIGFTSYLAIMLIISLSYMNLQNQIDESNKNSKYSTWPVDFQAGVNTLVKDYNLIMLMKYTDFSFDDKTALNASTKGDQITQNNMIINLISQSSGESASRLVFELLRQTANTFQFGQYYDPSNITGVSSVPIKYVFYSVPYTTTIHYSIILSYQHTFRYAVGLGTGRPEYYMILNNLNFNEALTSVQERILETQTEIDNDLQSSLTAIMWLTIGLSALCLSVIIPLFIHVQHARQEVVGLFTTFSTEAVQDMLLDIQIVYENIWEHLNSTNVIEFKERTGNEGEVRKGSKNTSESTTLPRMNNRLLISLAFMFILIIIQPIINRYLIQSYLTDETLALKTEINLYSVKGYIATVIALHYNNIFMKLHPSVKPIQVENYMAEILELLDKSDSMEQKLELILEEQSVHSRYAQEEYDSFFFSLFSNNICTKLSEYPQYIANSTWVNSVDCESIENGFLTQGLQVSLKKFLGVFPDLYEMYGESTNASMVSFAASFDLEDFTQFGAFLEQTFAAMRNFLQTISSRNYDRISIIKLGLYCYQVCLLTVVFLIGWGKFSRNLKISLEQSKQYLSIIDVLYLLKNNYVLSYIKKTAAL